MKIHCNVCDTAEATVLCCADEAALCHECDEMVHAANKLASKHQRVSLSHSSSQMPKKKPSSEKPSDAKNRGATKQSAPISVASQYDRVGLAPSEVGASMPSKSSMPVSVASEHAKGHSMQSGALEDMVQPRLTFCGGSAAGTIPQWPMDDFLGLIDSHQNYSFSENGSFKADSGKLGESDFSPILRSMENELDSDDRLGQMPDVSWTVPQVPSPPTASGLSWPKNSQHLANSAIFVPDISCSIAPSSNKQVANQNACKRRRQL